MMQLSDWINNCNSDNLGRVVSTQSTTNSLQRSQNKGIDSCSHARCLPKNSVPQICMQAPIFSIILQCVMIGLSKIKQKQRMVQRIWLRCSRFLIEIATLNNSNSPTTILNHCQNTQCILFLLKLSFKRETIAKIGCATALKLLLYEPIFSAYRRFFELMIQ